MIASTIPNLFLGSAWDTSLMQVYHITCHSLVTLWMVETSCITKQMVTSLYPLINSHNSGKSPFELVNHHKSSIKLSFSLATLTTPRVVASTLHHISVAQAAGPTTRACGWPDGHPGGLVGAETVAKVASEAWMVEGKGCEGKRCNLNSALSEI